MSSKDHEIFTYKKPFGDFTITSNVGDAGEYSIYVHFNGRRKQDNLQSNRQSAGKILAIIRQKLIDIDKSREMPLYDIKKIEEPETGEKWRAFIANTKDEKDHHEALEADLDLAIGQMTAERERREAAEVAERRKKEEEKIAGIVEKYEGKVLDSRATESLVRELLNQRFPQTGIEF